MDVLVLREDEANTRFPVDAHAYDLKGLISNLNWNSNTVQCIVLEEHSVRLSTEMVHLAKSFLGLVHKFSLRSRDPYFCSDLGKLVRFTFGSGQKDDSDANEDSKGCANEGCDGVETDNIDGRIDDKGFLSVYSQLNKD